MIIWVMMTNMGPRVVLEAWKLRVRFLAPSLSEVSTYPHGLDMIRIPSSGSATQGKSTVEWADPYSGYLRPISSIGPVEYLPLLVIFLVSTFDTTPYNQCQQCVMKSPEQVLPLL